MHLVAKRDKGVLNVELTLPPRANGFSESYMVFVAPQGEQFGRHLDHNTSRDRETSNKRLITTELTDRERSVSLDVRVEFSVWKRDGIHSSTKLFEDVKVVNVPLPGNEADSN